MKIINSIIKFSLVLVTTGTFFTACNKLELDPTPDAAATQDTVPTLATLLDAPEFSLLKAAATKGGLIPTLKNPKLRFTLFAPDNDAITASLAPLLPPGVTAEMYIGSLDAATAYALVSYHLVPQEIPAASISTDFPNFQYPTNLNPAPTVSPLLRLTTFPSVRTGAGAWVNNVPIIATDIQAVNGVMHKVLRIVAPPSTDLWSRIQSDGDLTYFKAAISRADTGVAAGSRLQDALNASVNPKAIASNLTIFAPTDNAMKVFLIGAITKALVAQGADPVTAQTQATGLVAGYGSTIISDPASIPVYGPSLNAVITPTLAKGIAAYHILSSQKALPKDTFYLPPGIRVFSVNIPSTAKQVTTLLNSGGWPYSQHPGVTIQATFVSPFPGVSVVSAATVKGAVNATASNIIIGPTSSDLHSVNGVLHKIDQVLLPQ
jgi:uncharacterized surface protein with fasciclin (FAS1) repeats